MMYGSIHSHFESDKDAVNAHFGSNGRISFDQALGEYAKLGAKKIAITEHGTFSSFEDIYASSKKFKNLEVIPGIEAYLDYKNDPKERAHLILVAKDMIGYEQLCKLITMSNRNTWVSKAKVEYPIMTMDMIEEICGTDKGHLICTSACIAGVFGKNFGLNLKNINDRIERHKRKLESHDYFTKKEDLDIFEEISKTLETMLPSADEVARVKETKDTELKKKHTQMRREAKAYKETPDYIAAKENALIAEKYIKSNRLQQTINLYNTAVEEKREYLEKQEAGVFINEAKDIFRKLNNIFGNDFYFELQNHHLPIEKTIYNHLVHFAFQMKHPQFIASNDIHIAMHKDNPEFENEVERRNVAKSMRFGSYDSLEEPDTYEYGIKTDEELNAELLEIIDPVLTKDGRVIANTEAIVSNAIYNIKGALEKCQPYEPAKKDHYPKFIDNDNELFEQLVNEGINKKFGGKLPTEEYEERLKKEIQVIESMGYASYHLIVQDYLTYGRLLGYLPPEEVADAPLTIEALDMYIEEKGYPRIGYSIGPGRGSAAGSLCCYLLGITDIDPIKYNLLFERFLNPERKSMPDVDCDMRTDIREKCTQYCEAKYGIEKVCKIMTKAYQQSKGCLRLASRYLNARELSELKETNLEYQQADKKTQAKIENDLKRKWITIGDKLAKMVDANDDPFAIAEEIESTEDEEVIDDNLLDELSTDILTAEERECVRIAKLSNGIFSGYGQHAAGVIISKDDISDAIPLMKSAKKERLQTQCVMAVAESKGLLKMDFLGLKNLDIITKVLRTCNDNKLQDYIEREKILKDPAIYKDIYCSGKTKGIFQVESAGMTNMLMELHPDCFEDIIAAISLYRPGPMDFIPQYIEGKRHPENITYICPELKEILNTTYGTIVYQEQVMQIFQSLAGYTMGGADAVRKAISKKKMEDIEAERTPFIYGDESRGIEGAIKKVGISEEEANALFNTMVKFGEYAFNKSHATAYALVSIFTAYLKKYHTAYFYAETMNYLGNKKAKVLSSYIDEMKTFGIELKAPSFLYSKDDFSVSEDGKSIYYGLGQIKGMSDIGEIYRTECLQEFITKNPQVSEKVLTVYAKLGMFKTCFIGEETIYSRDRMLKALPKVKPAIDNLLSLKTQILENNKARRDSEENANISKLEAEHQKLIEKYTVSRTEMIKTFNEVRNMQEPIATDKRRMDRYATEKEYLFTIFSAKEDVEILKDYDMDFGILYKENARAQRIPALVLSISSARKTKSSNKTYYQVELMDKNGEVISRRFENPPQISLGTFLIQPEETKFFYCKECYPLKERKTIHEMTFADAMQGIADGTIHPSQLRNATNVGMNGTVIDMIGYTDDKSNMEEEDKCMELSS